MPKGASKKAEEAKKAEELQEEPAAAHEPPDEQLADDAVEDTGIELPEDLSPRPKVRPPGRVRVDAGLPSTVNGVTPFVDALNRLRRVLRLSPQVSDEQVLLEAAQRFERLSREGRLH
jgi:hypothetical protein